MQDMIAMRIVDPSTVVDKLAEAKDEFEPPYIPLGGVLPLDSLSHWAAASDGVAATRPILAVLAALGSCSASSVLAGSHPWWNPPLTAPLPGLVPDEASPQGSAQPGQGARQVAFADEVQSPGNGDSPSPSTPTPSPIPQASAGASGDTAGLRGDAGASSAAPVTPVQPSSVSARLDMSTALTPAFDETAVLSLDDIENMLGMSNSAGRDTQTAAGEGSGSAPAAHGGVGRGTAPPPPAREEAHGQHIRGGHRAE